MLWRLNAHVSFEKLIQEVETAFPDIIKQVEDSDFFPTQTGLAFILESRFN